MARIRVFRTCVFVVAILLWLPRVSLAQGTASSLSGVVTDASGAVIPGANVTVTNIGTNVAKTVHTDGVGHYLVTDLTPGSYSLLVDASGFEGKKVSSIQLVVAQETRQDVALAVGGNTQVV